MSLPIITSKDRNTNMKLTRLFYKYADEMKEKERRDAADNEPEKDYEKYPPYNFSWFIPNKIAAMGWPQTVENLNYLAYNGVDHLVTLSPEKIPPILECEMKMKWSEVPVKEFGAPTLKQIIKFIEICERAEIRGETVGVHCRHGRGRTGTMLACYLVHFRDMVPERAVLTVRVQRPGSCETYEQEKAVCHYHDCLRGTVPKPDYRLVDDKPYFDSTMRHLDEQEVIEETEEEREAAREEKRRLRKLRVKAMVINHHIYF